MVPKTRKNFGKLQEVIDPPNLIQNQIDSFDNFLQRDVPSTHRKHDGLEAVFKEVFPILSYDEKSRLEYVSYSIGESKLTEIAFPLGELAPCSLHVKRYPLCAIRFQWIQRRKL